MSYQMINGVMHIEALGVWRKLGALKPDRAALEDATKFASIFTTNPATWQDQDWSENYRIPVRDQLQLGDCQTHAGVTALAYGRAMEGLPYVNLSCTMPYALVNGGRDNGTSLTSILDVLKRVGTCTEAEFNAERILQRQLPKNAHDSAANNRIAEAYLCRNFEEICEAINRRFPVAFSIGIGQNFSRLNAHGIAPLPDMAVGGTSLCGIGIKKFGSSWLVKAQNSWGLRWGMRGLVYLTRGHFDRLLDAYAVQFARSAEPMTIPAVETREPVLTITPTIITEQPRQLLAAFDEPCPQTGPEQSDEESVVKESEPEVQELLEQAMEVLEKSELDEFLQENASEPNTVQSSEPPPVQEPSVVEGPGLVHSDPESIVPVPEKPNGDNGKRIRHRH